MTFKSVNEYMQDRDVFITGATGFVGKALLEKLLRSCDRLNRVYILVRPKKNKSVEERLRIIFSSPLFDKVKSEKPNVMSKVSAVFGDVCELGLGLSAEDMNRLNNVSIIYHAAASVRFDDPLKYAVLLNMRGTRELLEIGLKLKKLTNFVHISTTFCYPDHLLVEEKIYPPKYDWRALIKACESYDEVTLDYIAPKLMNYDPNTYTFTKGLTEHICLDYKDKLPICIFRPSVITNAILEPMPGWIDSFNGPCGMTIACGIGLQRTMYFKEDPYVNMVPVDVCVNGIIVSAYLQQEAASKTDTLPIYNCSTMNNINFANAIEIGKTFYKDIAFEQMFWIPGGNLTPFRILHWLRLWIYQLLPAVLIDFVLRNMDRKPFMLKMQRLIAGALSAIHFFVTHVWDFKSTNYDSMGDRLSDEDRKTFFLQPKYNFEEYAKQAAFGGRRYLLNQSDDTIPVSRRRYKKLYVIDLVVKYLKYLFFIYIVAYKIFPFFFEHVINVN